MKLVFQTSINAPRQKNQAIVKQACEKGRDRNGAEIGYGFGVFLLRCRQPRHLPAISMPTCRCTRRRWGRPIPRSSCASSSRGRSRRRRTNGRGATCRAGATRSTTRPSRRRRTSSTRSSAPRLFIKMNDLVVGDPGVIPDVYRPRVAALSKKLRVPLSGWDNDFWDSARLVPRDVMPASETADWRSHARGRRVRLVETTLSRMPEEDWMGSAAIPRRPMSRYLLRRLADRGAEHPRHQHRAVRGTGARPGRPVRGTGEQPQRAARSGRRAARQVRARRPDVAALPALARRDAAGRLGLFVRQPDGCRAR